MQRKEGSHSLTAVEAFAGREASRQPRFCIRLARGVGSLRAGEFMIYLTGQPVAHKSACMLVDTDEGRRG